MAKADIGEVQKLVVVGDGFVAAIGSKGTVRFNWMRSHSRGGVDESDDIRVNAVVRHGFKFPGGSDLADALPVGAVIPLPSEKRAQTWMKQDRGPKQDSRWHFESAIQAGFRPRYYLGEDANPYESGTKEHSRWDVEKGLPRTVGWQRPWIRGTGERDSGGRAKVPQEDTRLANESSRRLDDRRRVQQRRVEEVRGLSQVDAPCLSETEGTHK